MQLQTRLKSRSLIYLGVVLLAALLLAAAAPQAVSTAAVVTTLDVSGPEVAAPLVLNYQGRLADPSGNPKADGNYTIFFALYDAQTGGTLLWSETRSVAVVGGLFSLRLGEGTAFPSPTIFDGRGLWLAITVAGESEATPRLQVSYVAYAMYANRAGSAAAADSASNASRLGGNLPSFYLDAGNITAGTLAFDRFNAYGDLANDARIGAAAGMVAAGLHTHTGGDIVDLSIGSADLADGIVTSAKIADGNVAIADLAANSVDATKIVDLSVNTADLANSSITSAKIADLNVATAELADSSVTSAKIADGAVANADLAASSVTTAKIADGSVTAAKLSGGLAPIAYGFILSNGAKNWGTSNVTSSWDATNSWYAITISGYSYFYSEYITVVTPTCGPGWSVSTSSVSGNLLVIIGNTSNVKAQCNFQFVTYH